MKTIFILAFGITFLTFSANGQFHPQNKDNTLLVKGVATLRQIPEIMSATIILKVESRNYNDCHDKIMTKLEKAKSAFISCNIDKALIKTNEIGVSQQRETADGKSFIINYIGNVSLIIESPYSTDFTRNLLSALKNDSLSLNYNISFKLSEAQKALLRQKAITMAIADANEKAVSIAESSKVKLVRINSISYLDDVVAWGRDWDIKREEILPSQNVFVTVGDRRSNNPAIDFNPKEIGIVKTLEIEWIISEDN